MSKLLESIKQQQQNKKYGPVNAVEKVYDQLSDEDKQDFVAAIADPNLEATLIAKTIVKENLSEYATDIGAPALTYAIRRVRRGEIKGIEVNP